MPQDSPEDTQPTDEDDTALTTTGDPEPSTPTDARPAPKEVFDADTGEMVDIDPDFAAQAAAVDQYADLAFHTLCIAQAWMRDENGYLARGYSSYKEYVEQSKKFSYRSGKRFARLGAMYREWMGDLEMPDDPAPEDFLQAVREKEETAEVARAKRLPKSAQHELAKEKNEPTLHELVETGRIVLPDGETEVTVEEVVAMKGKELKETLQQARMEKEAYQALVEQKNEKIDLLESEKEHLQEQNEEAEEKEQHALEIKRKWGPEKRDHEAKAEALEEADRCAKKLREHLLGHGIEFVETDAQRLKTRLVNLVREIGAIFRQAQAQHAGAIESALDTQALVDLRTEADGSGIPQDTFDQILAEDDILNDQTENGQMNNEEMESGPDAAQELQKRGWGIEPDLEGKHVLKNPKAGYKTQPHDHLDKAIEEAQRIEEKRREGTVPDQYRIPE